MSTTPITPPLDDEEPKHTAILIETDTERYENEKENEKENDL